VPGTIVFDVNETLLDLSALDPHFEHGFGSAAVRKEWFAEMLKQAFVTTVTGAYSDFGALQRSALLMMEARHRKPLAEEQRTKILQGMQQLPPHREVSAALARLRATGWRLATLTNSTLQVAEAQLHFAGLRGYFERVLSADMVRRLKPAPEPYAMAVRELGAPAAELTLVAAHSWDVAGAAAAGWKTAFLSRPGQMLDSLTPQPAFLAADLAEFAAQLLKAA
jgi:2-haloacid dehalogenase